jgi:polyphosphate kinase
LEDVEERSVDGLTPAQQLAAIAAEADALTESQQNVWRDLVTSLGGKNIDIVTDGELDAETAAWLETHFRTQIFPVLTPQAIDPRIRSHSSPTRASA